MKALLLALVSLILPLAASADCDSVKATLQEGDLLFLAIDHLPFRQVAETTKSWSAHVGVAFQEQGKWVVYESAIPTSRVSDLCAFIAKGSNGRLAVTRHAGGLNGEQIDLMRAKAKAMLGYFYHTGFDFDDTSKQFCSKFTYLVYEAAGLHAGKIETFQDLFDGLPAGPGKDALVTFWNRWFMAAFRWSGIPWARRTVTPASQLNDTSFEVVLGTRE